MNRCVTYANVVPFKVSRTNRFSRVGLYARRLKLPVFAYPTDQVLDPTNKTLYFIEMKHEEDGHGAIKGKIFEERNFANVIADFCFFYGIFGASANNLAICGLSSYIEYPIRGEDETIARSDIKQIPVSQSEASIELTFKRSRLTFAHSILLKPRVATDEQGVLTDFELDIAIYSNE